MTAGRVLVTGCSSGFGRATAIELAKRGFEVVATARRPETLDDLDVAQRLALDVTSDEGVAAAVAAAGPLDVLVNNAGIDVSGPIERVPLAEAKRVFETNLWGAVRLMQAVAPGMRERGSGTIVNVSSVAGRVSAPLLGFYSASKHALGAVSEAAALELGHFGVRVLLVEPGEFATNIQQVSPHLGVDEPPYDELDRIWSEARGRITPDPLPGPEPVAALIADAIESDDPKVHWPVGEDAELVVGTREALDYESFVATMRQTLGIDW
jgi:NAD(P)-dependent dehydrogenase (short-subunit alcohol dehydrogenase family)